MKGKISPKALKIHFGNQRLGDTQIGTMKKGLQAAELAQNVIWCRADLRFKIPPKPIPKGRGITALFYDKIGVTDVWYAVTRPAGQAFSDALNYLEQKGRIDSHSIEGALQSCIKDPPLVTVLWTLQADANPAKEANPIYACCGRQEKGNAHAQPTEGSGIVLFGDSTWGSHARPGCQRERSLACQVNGACLLSACKGPISVAQRARNFFWSIQAEPSAPVKLVVPDQGLRVALCKL